MLLITLWTSSTLHLRFYWQLFWIWNILLKLFKIQRKAFKIRESVLNVFRTTHFKRILWHNIILTNKGIIYSLSWRSIFAYFHNIKILRKLDSLNYNCGYIRSYVFPWMKLIMFIQCSIFFLLECITHKVFWNPFRV